MVEHEIILSNHLSLLLSCAMSNAKRVSLELGGKSPLIIFGDCDMDKAVRQVSMLFCFIAMCAVSLSRWELCSSMKGENCIAAGREFVDRSIHDEFVERVVSRQTDR